MNYEWMQFPDETYILSSHPLFSKLNEKWLKSEKETNKWMFVVSYKPPEHYGLKEKVWTQNQPMP